MFLIAHKPGLPPILVNRPTPCSCLPNATAQSGGGLQRRITRPQLAGLGLVDSTVQSAPSWLEQLTSLGTAYLGYRGQRDLQKINTDRLRAGLEPISAVQSGVSPTVTVQHEVSGADGLKRMLLPAAAIGGAIWLAPKALRALRRR